MNAAEQTFVRVLVYGTEWCGLTHGFRSRLDQAGIRYRYHDIDREPEAEVAIMEMNGGKRKFPMVVVGEVAMKNPALRELDKILSDYGLLDPLETVPKA